ncbi:hypothetical protein CDAR_101761 [Caerostris darwini]|uniref:Uncharacterized protein n=1 Tax=Caerostris darwini TaxID=1538125 RepID=A0AAV4S9X8_9ARAC|nr:hypothetical protein CDAR_101761 [Caerostris darwini]
MSRNKDVSVCLTFAVPHRNREARSMRFQCFFLVAEEPLSWIILKSFHRIQNPDLDNKNRVSSRTSNPIERLRIKKTFLCVPRIRSAQSKSRGSLNAISVLFLVAEEPLSWFEEHFSVRMFLNGERVPACST